MVREVIGNSFHSIGSYSFGPDAGGMPCGRVAEEHVSQVQEALGDAVLVEAANVENLHGCIHTVRETMAQEFGNVCYSIEFTNAGSFCVVVQGEYLDAVRNRLPEGVSARSLSQEEYNALIEKEQETTPPIYQAEIVESAVPAAA
jgi:hypothetical protein